VREAPIQRGRRTLILTEKPSVARDFARALGVRGKQEGFLEDSRYIITWAIGHLVALAPPEDYDPRWKPWRLETLPIIPETFRYRPIPGTRKQLKIVRRLLDPPALSRVVIATDAGREGEVIARTILMAAGFTAEERVLRFWTSQALTPEIIRDGMAGLRPAASYDRLWKAGQARQIADWLVGMSCSRAATLISRTRARRRSGGKRKKGRDVFSVGRVQTAVLALIVDRKRARDAFVPEPFWILRAGFINEKGRWWGTWHRGDQRRLAAEAEAEKIRAAVDGQTGQVTVVETRKKREPPPLLYALTDLQRDANQKFGLSAKQTLETAQALYERKKCLSYPRTDARVLGSGNVDLARTLVEQLSQTYPEWFAGVDRSLLQASNKRVFNDRKLTDHHALIPLLPLPDGVGDAEKKVYDLVLKRFAAAFHPHHEYEQTEVVTQVAAETFKTWGRRTIRPGWKQVYGGEGKPVGRRAGDDEEIADDLPPLVREDPARVEETAVARRMTQAPPEYTEAGLLKDMSHPGRYVAEDALRKIFRGEIGLGTQATRAQIIETLLLRAYVVRRKKHLLATDKGCLLVDTLRRFQTAKILASPEETARWEAHLERIARGSGSDEDFLYEIKATVTKMIDEFKAGPRGLGRCPACGGEVISGKRDYGCANWRPADGGCRFVLASEIGGRKLSAQTISTLLSARQVGPLSGFLSEQGEPFNGVLRLVDINGRWQVRLDVSEAPPAEAPEAGDTVIGKCPQCGGSIVENPKSYGCENWRDADGGCRFVIWKEMAQKRITPQMAAELIQKGRLGPLEGFVSRKEKPFAAALKLVPERELWSVRFDFGASNAGGAVQPPIGKCPACGGEVTRGPRAYGCANWREADGGCRFVIWRTIARKEISPAVAAQLLERGTTELMDGFISRKGASFSARLRLSTEGPVPKVEFVFSDAPGG
jgi:DNA topoisomerase-3